MKKSRVNIVSFDPSATVDTLAYNEDELHDIALEAGDNADANISNTYGTVQKSSVKGAGGRRSSSNSPVKSNFIKKLSNFTDPSKKYKGSTKVQDPSVVCVVHSTTTIDSTEMGGEVQTFEDESVSVHEDDVSSSQDARWEEQPALDQIEVYDDRHYDPPPHHHHHMVGEAAAAVVVEEANMFTPSQYEDDDTAAQITMMPPQVVVHTGDENTGYVATPASQLAEVASRQPTCYLLLTAVGARNLAVAQRFGTQTPYLELHIEASGIPPVRSIGHKKGGTKATWNQNFILSVVSRTDDFLAIAVKNANATIGISRISVAGFSHSVLSKWYIVSNRDTGDPAGEVQLQIRVVDELPDEPFQEEEPETVSPKVLKDAPKPLASTYVNEFIRKGLLVKIPCRSSNTIPKRQWFVVEPAGGTSGVGSKNDGIVIHWSDTHKESKVSNYIRLCDVKEITRGRKTKAFLKHLNRDARSVPAEESCFSLVTGKRTLDLGAASREEADRWVDGLSAIVFGPDTAQSLTSARIMNDFKETAMTPRRAATPTSEITAKERMKKRQDKWMRTLFENARNGAKKEIADALAEGCPVDLMESKTGDTVLLISCRRGYAKIVKLCLSYGAKTDPHPDYGEPALQEAVVAGKYDCVDVLLRTAAKYSMDAEISNILGRSGDAPLHVAATAGDIRTLELLMQHGADVTVLSAHNETPLNRSASYGHYECAAYLLDGGSDDVIDSADYLGNTPLHNAARIGADDIVTLLLESAANVQSTNLDGKTPYELARDHNQAEAMALIEKYIVVPSPEKKQQRPPDVIHVPASPTKHYEPTIAISRLNLDSITKKKERRHKKAASQWEEHSQYEHSTTRSDSYDTSSERSYDYAPSWSSHNAVYHHQHEAEQSHQPETTYTNPSVHSARFRVRQHLSTRRGSNGVASSPAHGAAASHDYHGGHQYYPASPSHSEGWTSPQQNTYQQHRYSGTYDTDHGGYSSERDHASYSDYQHSPHSTTTTHHHHGYNDNSWEETYESPASSSYYGHESHQHETTMTTSEWDTAAESTRSNHQFELNGTYWDECFTETGDQYFINAHTGQSQWEDPRNSLYQDHDESYLSPSNRIRAQLARRKSRDELVRDDDDGNDDVYVVADTKQKKSIQARRKVRQLPTLEMEGDDNSPEKKTVWQTPRTSKEISVDTEGRLQDDERKEIESLLSPADSKDSFASPRASSPRSKSKIVKLLDVKRANNIAIGLKQFKSVGTYKQIVTAVVGMDETLMPLDSLEALRDLLPTSAEIEKVKAYTGPYRRLGKAEQFFKVLSHVIRFQSYVDCFIFKSRFKADTKEIQRQMDLITQCCSQLLNNKKLASVLQKLVVVKNALNEVNGEEEESGITIDSLLETTRMTGADGETSVIKCVVNILRKQEDSSIEDSLDFSDEIRNLNKVVWLDNQDIESQLEDMSLMLKKLRIEIKEQQTDRLKSEIDNVIEEEDEEMFDDVPHCMSNATMVKVQEFERSCEERIDELERDYKQMKKATTRLTKYFGESRNSTDKIFSTLLQFLEICMSSRRRK